MHCDWQGKFAWMPENLWQQLEPLLPKYPRRSKVGRPLRKSAPSPVVFFICCAPAASGRHSPHNLAAPVPFIAISKSGHAWVFGGDSGSGRCGSTIRNAASLGDGSRWTARQPSRRWAGKKSGKNPTDRGKLGVKRSVLTDARGVPLGVAIDGANAHDQRLLRDTLRSIPIQRPGRRRRGSICVSTKGTLENARPRRRNVSDTFLTSVVVVRNSAVPAPDKKPDAGLSKPAHSWTNRARRLLIRWEKKAANYLGFVHLQFGLIALRRSGILG